MIEFYLYLILTLVAPVEPSMFDAITDKEEVFRLQVYDSSQSCRAGKAQVENILVLKELDSKYTARVVCASREYKKVPC